MIKYFLIVGVFLPFDKHLKYLTRSFRCRILVCLQWWEESFYYFASIYQNCLIKFLPHTNNCFQFCTFFWFKRWCLLLCKRQGIAYLKHVFLWKITFLKFISFVLWRLFWMFDFYLLLFFWKSDKNLRCELYLKVRFKETIKFPGQ